MRKAETLNGALYELAKVIYSPIDPFTAMQELIQLQWQPGREIGEYFSLVRRKAAHARTTLKLVASMVSAQLTKEVQNRLKGSVTGIDEDLDHPDAFKFVVEVKGLTDKGFALNLGNRHSAHHNRIATVKEKSESTLDSDQIQPQHSKDRVALARSRSGWRKQAKSQDQPDKRACYICNGKYFWKYCPDKRCPACGQNDLLNDCRTLHKNKDVQAILTTNTNNLVTELSVLISVKLNGMHTEALIDSGSDRQ